MVKIGVIIYFQADSKFILSYLHTYSRVIFNHLTICHSPLFTVTAKQGV